MAQVCLHTNTLNLKLIVCKRLKHLPDKTWENRIKQIQQHQQGRNCWCDILHSADTRKYLCSQAESWEVWGELSHPGWGQWFVNSKIMQ